MKNKRRVKRASDQTGALPTAKEVALVRELEARWRLELPQGYARDLPFVRGFLDVFALGADNPPEQVLRRLRNARQLAWDGLVGVEIARKLGVPEQLGAVLHAYGMAQVPRWWRDEGGDAPLLDRLTAEALDGDTSAITALSAVD